MAEKLKIIPLGGLDEIGKNITVLEYGKDMIAIDCGVNDFFSQANRDLHELLLKNKVAHDYQERPGGHTWEYWNRVFPYASVFFRSQFRPVVVELMKQNMR